MRTDPILVLPPCLDDDLRIAHGVEDLAVRELVPLFPVEALVVAVRPTIDPLDRSRPGLTTGASGFNFNVDPPRSPRAIMRRA